jgi:predicted RNase H-like nuclease (RuvC/YqgF family)
LSSGDTESIIAFDILPMSSTARQEGVKVAASACFSDGTRKEWSELNRSKLLKIVRKHRFTYMGTDNPGEVISEAETLADFCDRLPVETQFVHVNLTNIGTTVSVQSLLTQYNINPSGRKLSPVKTARGLVDLIRLGIGMILEPYENETLIRVGRPSGTKKGGWSQSRYQRLNEEVVAREANKINELLIRANLQFDSHIQDTKYGAKMARFHIFSTRMNVEEALSNQSFYPAKIKIWSPKKNLVTYRAISQETQVIDLRLRPGLRRIIVGIDPGMTTGVAIINLSGNIVAIFSKKNLSKGQLITDIAKYGVPVLICSDVSPTPTFVSKMASTYNANIISPDVMLRKEDKRSLSNLFSITRKLDSHERDALSAVAYAYKRLEENFSKVESEDLPVRETELAKTFLIRGLSVKESLAAATKISIEKHDQIIEEKDYHEKDLELVGRVNNLLEQLTESQNIIRNLRAHAATMEAQKIKLNERMKKLERQIRRSNDENIRDSLRTEIVQDKDRIIKNFERTISDLQRERGVSNDRINDLEEMLWVTIDKGGLPIKILQKFSNDAIQRLVQERNLGPGDIVLIIDPTGGGPQTAEKLVNCKPDFVFLENHNFPSQASETFYKAKIPVLRADKYGIIRTNYLGVINQVNYLHAKEEYQEIIKEREEERRTAKILQTIEDYKYERAKELKDENKNYDDYEPMEDEQS